MMSHRKRNFLIILLTVISLPLTGGRWHFRFAEWEVYHLRWDNDAFSPCIDAGDPSLSDPVCNPSDMGCYPAMTHDYLR